MLLLLLMLLLIISIIMMNDYGSDGVCDNNCGYDADNHDDCDVDNTDSGTNTIDTHTHTLIHFTAYSCTRKHNEYRR